MKCLRRTATGIFFGGLCFFTLRVFGGPAFPGAEGPGANAVGGRGGTVYHVTNTNNSGAGSLRTGVSVGNRTIVFDVSGTIDLQTDLVINKNNLTIAGQTAPGDGITLKRRLTTVQNCRDVIVRFLRCRPGDAGCTGDTNTTFQDDAFHFVNATNCIADHISSSWSVDEALSCTHSTNITVQWCFITESMKNSCHPKGAHGYGSLIRYDAGQIAYHHNLYADHDSRNPRLGDRIKLDFVNNVVYNWGMRAGYSGSSADLADNPGGFTNYLNYVNNYLVAGPSSTTPNTAFASGATTTFIYQSGNLIDTNQNAVLDGANNGAGMFNPFPYTVRGAPYPLPPLTTDSPPVAYQRVLAFGGASSVRDAVDARVVSNVVTHTGAIINSQNDVGGWPVMNSLPAPADFDQDGMPDYWELNLGLNPAVTNHNHLNLDGYTDLEEYLNWLAAPHATIGVNQTAIRALHGFVGNNSNMVFYLNGASNGVVSLSLIALGTIEFTPTTNFIGLASFTFTPSNAVDQVSLGPVTVNVLVTNLAPSIVVQPAARTNSAGTVATFSVGAANAALNFQWRKNLAPLSNGGNVSGATTAMLTLSNVTAADGGSYSVVITNFSGTATSSGAALTILSNTAPTLTPLSYTNSQFQMLVNGDAGPNYIVQASSNLVDWETVFTTNSPPVPWTWTDVSSGAFGLRFYRVLLGP